MKKIYLLMIVMCALSMTRIIHAETRVTDTVITGNVSWLKTGSPYIVTNNLSVDPAAVLTIEPGVEVRFENNANLIIAGKMQAIGTATDPIAFIANQTAGAWGGVSFVAASGSVLDHVVYRDAINGVSISKGNLEVRNSNFSAVRGTPNSAALLFSNNSTGIVSNTTITSSHLGIGVVGTSHVDIASSTIRDSEDNMVFVLNNSSVAVRDSVFDGSHGFVAIGVTASSSATIVNTVVANGSGNGIAAFSGSLLDMTKVSVRGFKSNGIVISNNSSLIARTSTISDNMTGLLVAGQTLGTKIGLINNRIVNNMYGINAGSVSGFMIPAENNWWGDVSGPQHATNNTSGKGSPVSNNVSFTPWLTTDPAAKPTCCSSVAFIPGLEASRLYKQQTFENQLWEPNGNFEVPKLYLDLHGKSLDPSIYTRDIIDTSNVLPIFTSRIYQSFIDSMSGLVASKKINGWEALPYDWRLDINSIVHDGIKYATTTSNMITEIEKLAHTSQTGKTTIVAHSNGGLIAKILMQELEKKGETNLVDTLIFVAVPQLGTPQAVAALLHGYDQAIAGGLIVQAITARTLGENMPGAYGLLPSNTYFQTVKEPIVVFDQGINSISNLMSKYGQSINGPSTLDNFLLGKDGRMKPGQMDLATPNVLNSELLTASHATHDSIDLWTPPAGIKMIQIAGWGVDTLQAIKYIAKYPCTKFLTSGTCTPYIEPQPVFTMEGDKIVVYPSAIGMATSSKTYYFDAYKYNVSKSTHVEHDTILEAASILDLIRNVIQDSITVPTYISTEKPNVSESKNRIQVSMHSPASIDLYDSMGNHTGVIPHSTSTSTLQFYEENVPNSYYTELGEVKYAGFDATVGNSVKIQGTGSGVFTLDMNTSVGDTIISSSTFANIPVTPSLKADLIMATSTSATSSPVLTIDVDGDGKTDFTLTSSQATDPVVFLRIMQKTITTLDLPEKVEKEIRQKINKVIKLLSRDSNKRAYELVEEFAHQLEVKKWKSKKVTQEQKDSIINMLNQFLDFVN